MNEIVALILILLLATSGYAAGRMHGQLSYRLGYRYGYRQGYFDGDRASWNRRRRELQAAVASVLTTPPAMRSEAYPPTMPVGTTYTSTAIDPDGDGDAVGDLSDEQAAGRHSRSDWALVDAAGDL